MRYPHDLRKNETIGFVAPSFGCATEPYLSAFKNAMIKWKAFGYQLELGPNCFENKGIGISNLPILCAKEFMDMYLSESNNCLLSCGGGELMCEILDDIDFDALAKANPKWFMGYSDNTNLTFLLTTLCDIASIYGPCAAAFGMEPWHKSIEDAKSILTGEKRVVKSYDLWEKESLKNEEEPLLPYNVTEINCLKVYVENTLCLEMEASFHLEIKGRLLGGCMDCLQTLIGTKYDKTKEFVEKYKEDGILWFLEACDLNVFSIRRVMWQMEHAGWFNYVKGFMIGRPAHGESIMGLDVYQAILEIISKYNVPVLFDLDIGHCAPMMPIVTGSIGMVQIRGKQLSLEMTYN